MGIKQDVDWNVARMVEKPIPETNQIFRKEELVHIHLFCVNYAVHSVWNSSVYEPFEELLQKKDDSVETTVVDGKKYQVITIESAPIVMSTSLYTKIYGKMPTNDFLLYVECDDTDLNYMLDEFYLALGQENRYSKFFHLFSIIEFVEKRDRVCGALKQTLGNLTDIGRKEKLVHILHQMGIRDIKNCGSTIYEY